MKRRILWIVLAVMMLALTACRGMTADDAVDYVQAVLDASYKEDFDEYTKQTDSTRQEAQQLFDDNLDNIMDIGGFTDAGLSQELYDSYRQLFKDMLAEAKYTVADAEEEKDNGFTVEVSAEPFTAFDGLLDEVMGAVQSEMENITDTSGLPSDDQINAMVFQKMYDLLAQRVAEPAYGQAQTVELHVKMNDDNVYYIDEDDLTELDKVLFPADNL